MVIRGQDLKLPKFYMQHITWRKDVPKASFSLRWWLNVSRGEDFATAISFESKPSLQLTGRANHINYHKHEGGGGMLPRAPAQKGPPKQRRTLKFLIQGC
jgi:hypothetical protein